LEDYGIYYVSTNGNDDQDGRSKETAFRTIEHAISVVQPGNTIQILPGIYDETLMMEGLGDPEKPIVLRGQVGETILDGQRISTIGFWCEKCTNLIVADLTFRNYTDIGLGVYDSSDIKIQNLTLYDNGFAVQLTDWELEGYGVHIDESSRISIEGCDVYQNGPQPRPHGVLGTGINTYQCTNCLIRDNSTHHNVGGGILVEDGIDVVVQGNDVFANYLDATEDEWWDGGIWIDGGRNVTVANNTFRENIGPGIQISDEDFQQPYGYVLENNRSTGNYYGIYIWNFRETEFPPENVLRMTNNQISGNTIQDVWIVP